MDPFRPDPFPAVDDAALAAALAALRSARERATALAIRVLPLPGGP